MKNLVRISTRILVAFALLLGIFAAGQSASAAPTVHVITQTVNIAAGGSNSATANCPAGNLLSGGGWRSDSATVLIMDNAPLSSGGWFARAINTDAAAHTLTAYAVCLTAAGNFTIVAGNWTSAGQGQQATSLATCSSGALSGGGFRVSGGAIKESYPHGPQWVATVVNNTSNPSVSVISLGVCLTAPAVNLSVVAQTLNINGGATGSVNATCGAGAVISGGGFRASNYMTVFASFPMPSTSGLPNTWMVLVHNNFTVSQPLTTYAVCAN